MINNPYKPLLNLFEPSDAIYTGTAYSGTISPIGSKTALEPFYALNSFDPIRDHSQPVNGLIKGSEISSSSQIGSNRAHEPRRSDLNVIKYKNFLLEMDLKPLDWQLKFWSEVEHKPTLLTYSGSKSYHAVYSLKEPLKAEAHTQDGVAEYKLAWQALAQFIAQSMGEEAKIFDRSCKNPSRLTRTPGFLRDGVEQSLIAVGPLFNFELIQPELNRLRESMGTPILSNKPYSGSYIEGSDLKLLLPIELYNKLRFPKSWAAPAGLYPELLRLTLWAIDACGVSLHDLSKFMEAHTFPALIRAGYPSSKLYKPLKDAYKMKGLL